MTEIPGFDLLTPLGRGGSASVWMARQRSLDRVVAIKVLSPADELSADDVTRFRTEARVAAQLKHPGIVEVYDAVVSPELSYLVMEYVSGYTFGDLMRRKGALGEEDVLTIAESVSLALDYAWAAYQVIHCDIKPDNIMVDADGTVKVTDLGLCHTLAFNTAEQRGEKEDDIFGTPAYMSPEQISGGVLDCRSDIYSLGATLYHMLTGQMLFSDVPPEAQVRCHVGPNQAAGIRTLRPSISSSLSEVIRRMLAKDAALRYADWKEVLVDLAEVRAGDEISYELPLEASSMRR